MPRHAWLPPLTLALALVPVAAAETVFRWLAPDGSVSFSSTPPPGVEAEVLQLEDPLPLSEAEREAQRERLRVMQELAEQLEQERHAREAAALSRSRRPEVTPFAPAPRPEPAPDQAAEEPAEGDGALEFDDWCTGPARPAPPSPPPEAPAEAGADHEDFHPNTTPTPSFH